MKRISEIELDKALELSACQHCGMPSHKLTTATISWGDNPPTDLHVDLCRKCLDSMGKRDKIKEAIRGVNESLVDFEEVRGALYNTKHWVKSWVRTCIRCSGLKDGVTNYLKKSWADEVFPNQDRTGSARYIWTTYREGEQLLYKVHSQKTGFSFVVDADLPDVDLMITSAIIANLKTIKEDKR